MRTLASFVILTSASLAIGCASQAPATAIGAAKSHEGSAAAASAVPQIKSAEPQDKVLAPQNASAVPHKVDTTTDGYDRVVVHGKELLCQMRPVTGSRIRQKVCLTQAQLQAEQQAAQQLIQRVQRGAAAGGQVLQTAGAMGSAVP